MPDENIHFMPNDDLLSFDELFRLISIFCKKGLKKVRFTGGEPFLRKGFIDFLKQVNFAFPHLKVHITTNGSLLHLFLDELKKRVVHGINISLDTLDSEKFKQITQRDSLSNVLSAIHSLSKTVIPIKVNMVVQQNSNADDILSMIDYFKETNIHLRFIEFMPFNERSNHALIWSGEKILSHIKHYYPSIVSVPSKRNATSLNYKLSSSSDFQFGIIEGFSRTFCGSCNRMRLTANGDFKTCLYADPVFNLKQMLRDNVSEDSIRLAIEHAISHRFKNGLEAQEARNNAQFLSMSKIGG